MSMNRVIHADNLEVLKNLPDGFTQLIYIDPPFNTGKVQRRISVQAVQDDSSKRVGFAGKTYRVIPVGSNSFVDFFDDYLEFLYPRLVEAHRVLTDTGSLFVHVDYHEVHYVKVLLDTIFGRECFKNEIIWAYDYGGRSKKRWPAKHDNILWYTKDPNNYTFLYEELDRIPYMAPGLAGKEKTARGKTPTDVWWHTIVSPTGKEKTGYPTQKPLGVIRRIVKVHSLPGDMILDFFAGSGTTGEVAAQLGRHFTLVDNNIEAIQIMRKRLMKYDPVFESIETS